MRDTRSANLVLVGRALVTMILVSLCGCTPSAENRYCESLERAAPTLISGLGEATQTLASALRAPRGSAQRRDGCMRAAAVLPIAAIERLEAEGAAVPRGSTHVTTDLGSVTARTFRERLRALCASDDEALGEQVGAMVQLESTLAHRWSDAESRCFGPP